jgi:1,4-alpha-glucan branching enzyme
MNHDQSSTATMTVEGHPAVLSDLDIHLFNEGTHYRLYDKLGAHPITLDGVQGTYFAVWAPNAEQVTVMGDFNFWDRSNHPLEARGSSGIWEGFVPGAGHGTKYKYFISSRYLGYQIDKSDPLAFWNEIPPQTASITWDLDYSWGDRAWMDSRHNRNSAGAPISVYEVHLGSWMRSPDNPDDFLSCREIAPKLAEYCRDMGFTHVELLPIMEHPYYPSWGYQTTGYFAPTSRYGTPQDYMYFVDHLHQQGIGVILDWVPSHFPTDGHGLGYFDGTHLYEHADPRKGFHPDWKSFIFNYDRNEVRSFLLSSALFWFDRYHVDGLRVDAVASMLYRDYSRREGEWIPNRYGGRENLESIGFLRHLSDVVHDRCPGVLLIAEESTAWPGVTKPTGEGGLGFDYKWNMGWMHDSLHYIGHQPVHRAWHHDLITFGLVYAFSERFVLPLSHDEVVHGKRSLLGRMPGDDWQRFANLRAYLGLMWGHPGKKLLFMGGELAQEREWNHDSQLDWEALRAPRHAGVQALVRDLNRLYTSLPALHQADCEGAGFRWLVGDDRANSVFAFYRAGYGETPPVIVVCNFTPVPRHGYRLGAPRAGHWREVFNSDAERYGGSNVGNSGLVSASTHPSHGQPFSIELTLPPLATIYLISEQATTAS